MNNEEQFKDSLKKLLDSKEFPFEEDSWDKAMLMRNAENSKKRIAPFLIAALILMVGGLLSYFYFTADETTAVAEQHITTPEHIPAGTGDASTPSDHPANSEKTLPANPARSNTSGAANQAEEPAPQPKNTAGSNVIIPEKTKAVPTAVTVKQPNKTPAANVTPQVVVALPVKQASHETAKPQAAIPAATPKIAVATPTQQQDQETVNEHTPAQPATPVEIAENDESITPAIAGLNNQDDKKNDAGANKPNEDYAALKTGTALPAAKAGDNNTNGTEQITSVNSPDAAETPVLPTNSEPVLIAKTDSSASVTTDPLIDMPNNIDQKIKMNFEAGVTFLTGWKNPGSRDAAGFNPVVGFNYFNYLTDKLSVSLGAQYTSVSHMKYASHISKTTRYNLGEESAVTVITPQKAHYIAVPIRLYYAVNKDNAFGIGFNFAYLLTVDSKMETYNEKLNKAEDYKASKTQGYTDGFKAFDTQLSVFYRRKIYKNLSAHAEFMFGMTDIKDNSFFNSNVFERNTGFKVTLMYNLFK